MNNFNKCALSAFFAFISFGVFALDNLWSKTVKPTFNNENKVRRKVEPTQTEFYQLDLNELKSQLVGAPVRGSIVGKSNLIISIPTSDGKLEKFAVMESPIMAKQLADKYPMIKTYCAQGVDDPTATMRFSITQFGFHAMILSGKHSTTFIDTYTKDLTTYIVYDREGLGSNPEDFTCTMSDNYSSSYQPKKISNTLNNTNDQKLRTYRLALCCNAEYGNMFAGTGTTAQQIANIQAQMVITMNRVNGVFERDLAITMEFIPNNDLLIYFGDINTDPWNGEYNTTTAQTIDGTIGVANYDIGHNFNTDGGGNAGCLACVCVVNGNDHKGSGMTGQPNPTGDPFDIDYVAHEMGHQFGGYHVMNTCSRSGNGFTEVEPASGSSIMGYAGICSSNIEQHSHDDFNYVNVRDISLNVQTGNSTCAQITTLTNTPPTANAGADYTIPKGTAYVLEGTANDADGLASLTYNWSQNDPDQSPGFAEPQSTYGVGPLYRSYTPSISPNRWMPKLSTVLSNTLASQWEVTPTVGRTINFSFIVRDNDVNGGQTASDLMQVIVDGNSGPFVITSQNASTTWNVGTTETISWNVANTTAAPVSAASVDIYLSTDGGYTYPTILASNIPNNGSALVNVPNLPTAQARIMVRGTGNIFYDVNNQDFTIQQSEFVLASSNANVSVCAPNEAVYTFTYNTFMGYTDNTSFSASGLPVGTSAVFSAASTSVNGTVITLTVTGITNAMAGAYSFSITGTSTSVTKNSVWGLTILSNTLSAATLSSPINMATGVALNTMLNWNAVASPNVTYQLQVATDVNFTNIVSNVSGITTSVYNITGLLSSTTYYWRVKAINTCTASVYSNTFSFTTNMCSSLTSVNVPLNISAAGTNVIKSKLTISNLGTINDVNVVGLVGTHTYINDLSFQLTSPNGTSISLFTKICNNENDFNLNFDDDATSSVIPCPATGGGFYQPENPLSVFNGLNASGVWTLTVTDDYPGDGGSLTGWGLSICTNNDVGIIDYTTHYSTLLFPNPTNGVFNLIVSSAAKEKFEYTITNNIGQIIETKNIDSNSQYQLDLAHQSAGVYYLVIKGDSGIRTEKIILQK